MESCSSHQIRFTKSLKLLQYFTTSAIPHKSWKLSSTIIVTVMRMIMKIVALHK